ncbi:helix-turn-helix domain-containing protein [Bdellovibrio svalbardensis]|uniref:Helix-turn-helix domain-containing protein n=1 Tax=Bdellovibrio svalbardensis TaxID=2972972 RepID=A0ABT6DHV3_9BACT|nr:helix-turn-helix transcriptional regulator [Bdellovibrio svalbardensis]MDG0816430.1 helix-turn-helix domain-containing protein [Bdellovibrio svalbardensis]
MRTKKKSDAVKFLESISDGPLTLGSVLNSLRLAEDMTQAQMAKKLRISTAHLSQIEKGHKFLSPERAQAFAKKLGHSPVMFVKYSLQDQLTRAKLPYKIVLEAS